MLLNSVDFVMGQAYYLQARLLLQKKESLKKREKER